MNARTVENGADVVNAPLRDNKIEGFAAVSLSPRTPRKNDVAWIDRLLAGWLARRALRWAAGIERDIQAESLRCIRDLEARWRYYNSQLKFKCDVSLAEIIDGFAMPVEVFILQTYPRLSDSKLMWMMIFVAIQKAGTHPQDELNAAVAALQQKYGANIPAA